MKGNRHGGGDLGVWVRWVGGLRLGRGQWWLRERGGDGLGGGRRRRRNKREKENMKMGGGGIFQTSS